MLALLWGIVLLAGCAAAVFQLFRGLNFTSAVLAFVLFVGLVVGVSGGLVRPILSESAKPVDLTHVPYQTSVSCQKCHSAHYSSWHGTYHRTMTQQALPETVLGDFDNVTVEFKGLACRLFREGDRCFMDLPSPRWENRVLEAGDLPSQVPDPERAVYSVDRLVGSHNMQVYLTRWSNGTYVTLPLVWHTTEQRWISETGSFLGPPTHSLYRNTKVWNNQCAHCHNTKSNPGIFPDDDPRYMIGWNTQLQEMGIACEACHGPGGRHVAANRNPARRYFLTETGRADPTIVHPARVPKELSVQVCGRCHGKWEPKPEFIHEFSTTGDFFVPGGERLEVRYDMPFPGAMEKEAYKKHLTGLYWPDWTPRATGMEYQGTVLSPCFQRGSMTCLSCHSMHRADPDDQLLFPDSHASSVKVSNRACTQCHGDYQDAERLAQHTHHPAKSTGSRCYDCHMPYHTYGLLKAVRSHLIASPNAPVSATSGLPNACNQCHVDRSLQWTAEWLARWYGQEVPPLSAEHEELSATLVDLLKGHALSRALAASMLGRPDALKVAPGSWRVPFLAYALDDPYDAVRLLAYQSLRKLPGFEDVEYDYLAEAHTRRRQIAEVRRRWAQSDQTGMSTVPHAFPLDPDGEPDRDLLERLLLEQDGTEIIIVE